MSASPDSGNLMEAIVSLCKRRGFVFPSSEIYGGFNGFFDYGPLGAELKKNIRDCWWNDLVRRRDEARAARDWTSADALRAELEGAGWLVEDGAEGTRIRRRRDVGGRRSGPACPPGAGHERRVNTLVSGCFACGFEKRDC